MHRVHRIVSFSVFVSSFPKLWFYSFSSEASSSTSFELECCDEAHFTVKEKLRLFLLLWYSYCHKNTSAWDSQPILQQSSSPLCISALPTWEAKVALPASSRLVRVTHKILTSIKLLCRGTSSVRSSLPVLVWLHSHTLTNYAVKSGIRTVMGRREDLYPL